MTEQSLQFFIFGNPVAMSPSPTIHSTGFTVNGSPNVYDRFDNKDIEEVVSELRKPSCGGGSVTIPHKESIKAYMDELTDAARTIGAVNTVTKCGDRLKGDNTDWLGIKNQLETRLRGRTKTNLTCLLCGAGGTARAAAYAMKQMGASRVLIYNRTALRAQELASEFGFEACADLAALQHLAELHVVVNTLPGSTEFTLPDSAVLRRSRPVVLEAAYIPRRTAFLRQAIGAGCEVVEGVEMLFEQGCAQCEIWTQKPAPRSQIARALVEALFKAGRRLGLVGVAGWGSGSSQAVQVTVDRSSPLSDIKKVLADLFDRPEIAADGQFLKQMPNGATVKMHDAQKIGTRKELLYEGPPLAVVSEAVPLTNLDEFDGFDEKVDVLSPRSLRALELQGVSPDELYYAPAECFWEPDLDRRIMQLHHDFVEAWRQDTLSMCRAQRRRILEQDVAADSELDRSTRDWMASINCSSKQDDTIDRSQSLSLAAMPRFLNTSSSPEEQIAGTGGHWAGILEPHVYPLTNQFFEDLQYWMQLEKVLERSHLGLPPHAGAESQPSKGAAKSDVLGLGRSGYAFLFKAALHKCRIEGRLRQFGLLRQRWALCVSGVRKDCEGSTGRSGTALRSWTRVTNPSPCRIAESRQRRRSSRQRHQALQYAPA
ncbi:ARO1 [Symbiodinium sp. CCMP2592]|nr:ARO1 [Symbiodinium sp. CCMP2592]